MYQKSSGGVISSSAARPHGTSEDENTGKLIPVDRKSDLKGVVMLGLKEMDSKQNDAWNMSSRGHIGAPHPPHPPHPRHPHPSRPCLGQLPHHLQVLGGLQTAAVEADEEAEVHQTGRKKLGSVPMEWRGRGSRREGATVLGKERGRLQTRCRSG